MLSTRGVTTRFCHVMDDLFKIASTFQKGVKADSKDRLDIVIEVVELQNRYLNPESVNTEDLWLQNFPLDFRSKFHIAHVHTMNEFSFTGNNLMFSRSLITFDPAFDELLSYSLSRNCSKSSLLDIGAQSLLSIIP